jgi:hypothetical protein
MSSVGGEPASGEDGLAGQAGKFKAERATLLRAAVASIRYWYWMYTGWGESESTSSGVIIGLSFL